MAFESLPPLIEYFEGIGFGRSEEPEEPHVHAWWPPLGWQVRDFPDTDIYDCFCGVRRMVPRGTRPDEGEDVAAKQFPESCPQWSKNYTEQPPLTLTRAPSGDAAIPSKDEYLWLSA